MNRASSRKTWLKLTVVIGSTLAVWFSDSLTPRIATAADILVFDFNSRHQFASTAALAIDPNRVVGDASNFNTLLASQNWSTVLIDSPSNIPDGGWGPTISFVNGGGHVAMSFWDWSNELEHGDPNLLAAFGLTSAESFSLNDRTINDTGATNIFLGVSMPNSDWHDHWTVDGGGFTFGLASGSIGLASLSGVAGPVMVLGNNGRTIASFVIDDAGDSWINDGSAVQLWTNMNALLAVPEPSSITLLSVGTLTLSALGVRRRHKHARPK